MTPREQMLDALRDSARREAYAKRQPLLHQGDVSTHAHFVESGCLRLWHNNDGNDISVQFFLPGDTVASMESFFHGTPSRFGLEAILPSVVYTVGKAEFQGQMARNPHFRELLLEVLVQRMADYQGLFLNRIMESPEERYRDLVARQPLLCETVPQHYLASFLGVTPVSLSRIRKRVENS